MCTGFWVVGHYNTMGATITQLGALNLRLRELSLLVTTHWIQGQRVRIIFYVCTAPDQVRYSMTIASVAQLYILDRRIH